MNISTSKAIKYIDNEISKDRVLYQDFIALRDYGLQFEELERYLNIKDTNDKIEIEFNLSLNKPFFNSRFLTKKQIEDITFSYSDFKISIDTFKLSNEDKENKRNIESMENLTQAMRQTEDEEIKAEINKKITVLTNKMLEEKEKIKRVKNEIETTINAQLTELKRDIEALQEKIKEALILINEHNKKRDIKSILNNFVNKRTIEATKRAFENNFKLLIYNKKLEIIELTYKVREKYLSLSLSDALMIPSILLEAKKMNLEKDFLKEDYKRLKNFRNEINEEIELIVLEEFQNLLLDNEEKETVSKIDLYKNCLPRYNKVLEKLQIKN